jgi:hypothetical protein
VTSGTFAPPPVRVLPATRAYDYEHVRDRLADPFVMDEAVAVCLFRAPLLAVPVGGVRRGGCMSFEWLTLALEVGLLLDGRPGFTDLRVRLYPLRSSRYVVEWGAEAPAGDDVTRGRFYGYSEDAIAEFCGWKSTKTPSSATRGRSPAAPFPPKRAQLPPRSANPRGHAVMCRHDPPCPTAEAPDREAARVIAHCGEQGWSLLCNRVVLFDDTGELLPSGEIIGPRRPELMRAGVA